MVNIKVSLRNVVHSEVTSRLNTSVKPYRHHELLKTVKTNLARCVARQASAPQKQDW